MLDQLQMLSQREQLMEDIGSIIESFRFETYDDLYELEKNLCDAVCKNFPANWCTTESLKSTLILKMTTLSYHQVNNKRLSVR